MCALLQTKTALSPDFLWLREVGLLAVLLFIHVGFVETATAQGLVQRQVQVSVYKASLERQSINRDEAILRLEYKSDGFAAAPVRLTAIIEARDQEKSSPWFVSSPVAIGAGRGVAFLKVRLDDGKSVPLAPFTTDKVTIQTVNAWDRSTVGVFSFPLSINWRAGNGGAPALEQPAAVVAGLPAAQLESIGQDRLPPGEAAISEGTEGIESASSEAAILPFAGAESEVLKLSEAEAILTAASSPARRATWQERLTLGPGDVLTLSIFGQPELTKTEVSIGPDGRISFLEAQDVMAGGRTIDELRKSLDEELAKYRRAPSTIITPVTFRSKKYFVLGKVTQKGVFILDRPTTIIEAVARARGLETSLRNRTLVEQADFSRSFLARDGKRVEVDFEKLFQAGDLSQNASLEPDDYLFFPGNEAKEVYVLGEVKTPGPLSYTSEVSAVNAIASRGGFTERAWKGKVLVVRGSLNRPEAFVVDANAVLSARAADFKLEPKDIVYVSNRPWIKAEELLDAAASAFVQSVVVTWTGGNIGPIIK